MINQTFEIISNNCWGAEVYKDIGLSYNTPFIGLFIPSSCFVKLASRPQYWLQQPLHYVETSQYPYWNHFRLREKNYPLALLGNEVEIHFLHYQSQEEASQKWQRRLKRMSFKPENLYIKFCDRDLLNPNDVHLFEKIPLPHKVFFSAKPYPGIKSNVWLREFADVEQVMDGKALYPVSQYYFDAKRWVQGKNPTPYLYTRALLEVRLIKKYIKIWA